MGGCGGWDGGAITGTDRDPQGILGGSRSPPCVSEDMQGSWGDPWGLRDFQRGSPFQRSVVFVFQA